MSRVLTDWERGWISGVIDSDGGIYFNGIMSFKKQGQQWQEREYRYGLTLQQCVHCLSRTDFHHTALKGFLHDVVTTSVSPPPAIVQYIKSYSKSQTELCI